METPSQFERDVKRADEVEVELLRRLVNNNPETWGGNPWVVMDVRKDLEYQKQDVDFLVKSGNKILLSIEAKIDFTKLPNFFFEIGRVTGANGCLFITTSDELWYYFVEDFTLYRFNMKALREYLIKTRQEIDELRMKKQGQEGLLPAEVEKLSWYKTATAERNSIGLAIPRDVAISILNPYVNNYKVVI